MTQMYAVVVSAANPRVLLARSSHLVLAARSPLGRTAASLGSSDRHELARRQGFAALEAAAQLESLLAPYSSGLLPVLWERARLPVRLAASYLA